MKGISTVFFLVGFGLFLGLIRYLILYQKPAAYPPRHLLKKQARTLAAGSVLFLLIGFIFYLFL